MQKPCLPTALPHRVGRIQGGASHYCIAASPPSINQQSQTSPLRVAKMHERRRRGSTGREHGYNPMAVHESTPQMAGYDIERSSPMTLEALAVELNIIKSVHGVWMKQKDEELHELRRKLEFQERELMQKNAELRLTGRGAAARQENRRLNNGDDNEQKKWWPPSFDCVVLVIVLIFTILQFAMPAAPPPPSQLLQAAAASGSGGSLIYRTSAPKVRIKPSESRPPKSIELFSSKDPVVNLRHKCLAAIRARHVDFYKSVFPKGQILLVDPAYHSNVGDHMLTLGEHQFIKRMGLKPPLECDYIQAGGFVPRCSEYLWMKLPKDVSVAMWHAGGNWGDVWRTAQEARVASFRSLLNLNLTIISMPQSLHYKSNFLEISDADKIRSAAFGFDYRSADYLLGSYDEMLAKVNSSKPEKKLAFTWRENESFERASKLYPFVTNVLVPDIAFQLGPYQAIPPPKKDKVDLLIFLRQDHESSVGYLRSASVVDGILQKMGKSDITYKIVDWDDRLKMFKSDDVFFTDTSIQLLSLGRVVICDRLHAAILAYLSGLPFVFIDQNTGKITKTLRVAFESSEDCQDGEKAWWAKATSLEHGIKKAVDLIDRYKLRSESSWSLRKFFKSG